MNIDKMIEKWEETHSSLLNEYSKGNVNNEVMQMYRSQMKNVLEFITELKKVKNNTVVPIVRSENVSTDVRNSISFTDEFNDDAKIEFKKGKKLEVIMIDAYGNKRSYFYLSNDMIVNLNEWLQKKYNVLL